MKFTSVFLIAVASSVFAQPIGSAFTHTVPKGTNYIHVLTPASGYDRGNLYLRVAPGVHGPVLQHTTDSAGPDGLRGTPGVHGPVLQHTTDSAGPDGLRGTPDVHGPVLQQTTDSVGPDGLRVD